MSKANRNRRDARAKIAEMRVQEARRRRRNWIAGIGAAVVVIIAAVGIALAVSGGKSPAASIHLIIRR